MNTVEKMEIRPGCRKCPLFQRLRYFVPSTVNGKESDEVADIMFLGEAPGENEAAQKEGFVGKSGHFLNMMLKDIKIDRRKVRFSNVLKCWPKGNKLPEDIDGAIECCSSYLNEDLEKAKVVVGLGALALKAITGYSGVLNRRGSVYEIEESGKPFICTLHPSYLRRLQYARKEERSIVPYQIVEADIAKAIRILNGEGWKGWKSIPLNIYPTTRDIEKFLQRLHTGEEKWVVFDIETTHQKGKPKIPILCGFYVEGEAICLSFEDDLEAIYWALKSPTPKVCQNGLFDVWILENLGFKVTNYIWDTMYAHHDMFAELPHSLKFIQSVYTWIPFHKDMVDWEEDEEEEEE